MDITVEHVIRVHIGSTLGRVQEAMGLVSSLGAPDTAVIHDDGDGPTLVTWTEIIKPGDEITRGTGRPKVS